MDINFTEDGKQTLEALSRRWPLILYEDQMEQAKRHIAWIMTEKKLDRADTALVLEAAKYVISPPKFYAFRNTLTPMDEVKRLRDIYRHDKDAYYAMPRLVKRRSITLDMPSKRPGEMKVLAINSSPRITGNTSVLIDEALHGARDAGASTEKFNLQKMNMKFCVGCRKCKEPDFKGICAIKDDMQAMYPRILGADAIVIGFPIYTGRESAQLSTFQDRCDGLAKFKGRHIEYQRRAMVIGTWGYVNDEVADYEHVINRIISWLYKLRCETTEAISACGFSGLRHGFDDNHKAIILRYPQELEKVYQAGKALVSGD